MKTNKNIELTDKEVVLIRKLQGVANDWVKSGKELWLYSASGTLWVMLRGDTKRNPFPEMKNGSPNPDNTVITINIANDGGDW